MNIMTSLLVSKQYKRTDQEFHLFRELENLGIVATGTSSEGILLDIFPPLRFFGFQTWKDILRIQKLRQELWDLVKARVKEDIGRGGDLTGVIQALVQLHQSEEYLDEENIMMVFADLIVAGTTTTTNTFYAYLNIICQHQEIQKRLRDEVDRVVGAGRSVLLSDNPPGGGKQPCRTHRRRCWSFSATPPWSHLVYHTPLWRRRRSLGYRFPEASRW
jgi:cytochrome P450